MSLFKRDIPPWQSHLIALGLLAVLTAIAYANSFKVPFTFDDYDNIVENHAIRMHDLSQAGLWQAATNNVGGHRYLPYISLALNFWAHGEQLWGYHLVNVLIHILAAMALYFLGLTTLKLVRPDHRHAREVALAAALLWALHPVQTNAVTYIVQRMASMAALFFFCSLLCYVLGRCHQGSIASKSLLFTLSLLCGLFAIGSKENAAMLPVMILAYEFFFLRDRNQRPGLGGMVLGIGIAGLGLLLLGLAFMGGDMMTKITDGYALRDFTLTERLLTEPRIVILYLSLLALPLPSRLNLVYDYQHSLSFFSPPQTSLALLAIAGLLALIPILFRQHRLVSFAFFWFLGNLVIESTVIPLELVFEHRIYLPSAFLFLAAVSFTYRWSQTKKPLVRAVLVGLTGLYLVFTWQRNTVWATEISLWSDVVAKAPNASRGYTNLGRAMELKGRHQEAEGFLGKALAIDAENGAAYLNLARVYEQQDRFTEALTALHAALSKKKADPAKVHGSLALVHRRMKNYPMALAEAKLALHLDPYLTEALLTMGIAYEETGEHQQALATFQQAKAEGLDTVDLYNNWAVTCFSLDMLDQAIGYLQHALKLDPEHPESHYNLGIAYSNKGLLDEARKEMALAMQLQNKKK